MIFWYSLWSGAKLLLLVILVISVKSAIRATVVGHHLRRDYGKPSSYEAIMQGAIEPAALAQYALNGRLGKEVIDVVANEELEVGSHSAGLMPRASAADARFRYLWERYESDAMSIKRGGTLVIVLSALLLVSSAYPMVFEANGNSRATMFQLMMDSAHNLLHAVSLGLVAATLLYALSGRLEKKLRRRKTDWDYFYAGVKNKSEIAP
jgi:hypothetical protein